MEVSQRDNIVNTKDIALAVVERTSSPLLTARHVSTFDDVTLGEYEDHDEIVEPRGRSATASSNTSERSHSRSSAISATQPAVNHRATSFSQVSSSNSGGPLKPPVASAMSRKLSSPFSWLSRKKTVPARSSSPPHSTARRHTAAAACGAVSNSDFMLSRLDEDKASAGTHSATRLPARESLKERFKMVRMREEAGVSTFELLQQNELLPSSSNSLIGLDGRNGDLGLAINGFKNELDDDETSLNASPPPTSDVEFPTGRRPSRNNSIASSFDPSLAPGTVSGISTGPSAMQDPEYPVDWDLWQSVVYEGPAAVAKTSAAELARAIASGIPNAIRGVVWQVLAQSKSEELEGVYRELLIRGTDKDPQSQSPNLSSGPHSANSLKSNETQKESITSSASSIHSGSSTPATTTGLSSPIVSQETDATNTSKLQGAINAERQKKAKDDVVAMKKLEKTIRKDLGARTNYSKYAAAAGLQESLFSVCKAYALFDEGVGYAQGMNFIIMPLLFNVREPSQLTCSLI